MDGRIPPAHDGALTRVAISQSVAALAIAVAAGGVALVSPSAALLFVAVLATRALIRPDQALRIEVAELTGPVLAALIVGAFTGLAGAVGVLFVWRWQADVRWSLRESDRLAYASGKSTTMNLRWQVGSWTTPFYGLALVAFTSPHIIAGLPLDLPHVSVWAPLAAGFFAIGALFDWLLRRAADWRLGELDVAPTVHMLTHHAIFLLAFGAMLDLSAGIVMLAAWRLAHAAPFRVFQPSLTAVP